MSKLKVGVIGVGGIAGAHMPGWAASEHAECVAGADLSEDALKTWGEKWGVAKRVSDPMELIDDPDLDVIDVCTPNKYHTPLTVAALEAGKHVICEKPLAPTVEDVRTIIDARDKAGKLVMTAQHFRFGGEAAALKQQIDAGALGDVYHARAWWLRRGQVPGSLGFLMKEHSGGGPCIDIGVHVLDLALHFMGQPKPVAVTGTSVCKLMKEDGAFSLWGRFDLPTDKIDVEDFAAAFVRFDNGATLMLECSWMLHHKPDDGTNEETRLWLYGDKGGAKFPHNTLHTTDNATKQVFDTKLEMKDDGKPHAVECMKFAEAIVNGDPSPVPPEDSIPLIGILAALYESGATGREVLL